MKLIPTLAWSLEDETTEPLDSRLLPLLDAIAASKSLASAVVQCGISYRAGWGLLRDYNQKIGAALVRLERGRGASLTPAGKRLLDARTKAARRLARILPSLVAELETKARRVVERALSLRIAASHDLVLAALTRNVPADAELHFDVAFMGSLNALDEFAEGRADLAGFHVPLDGQRWDRTPFWGRLNLGRDRLLRFVDREQGLILPRGNPAHVRSLSDIAAKGLRFVNRQRGSGTRLLVDQILANEGIEAAKIRGYEVEEFTHPAVAATVASGGADAGFGLCAAGAEYELAFVPLVRERYFIAVRAKDLDNRGVARFIDMLRSPQFARIARRFPGYRSTSAGAVATLKALSQMGSAERDSPGTTEQQ